MAVGDIVSTESVRRRGRIVPTESVLPKADETVPPGGPGLTPPRVERAPLPRAGFSFDPSVYPQSYTGPEMRAAGQGLRPPTPKETERWAQAGQEAYERGVIREAKQEQQSGLGQRFERWRLGNVYGLAPATTESRGKIGLQERWARTSEKQGYPEDESAVRAAIRTVGPVGMSWVERSRLAAADTYADPDKGKQTIAQLPDSRLAQEVNKFGGKFGETIKPEDLQRDPALRKQAEQELFEGATKIARTHIGFEQERAERGEKWYSKGLYGAVEMLPYMSNIALGRAAFTVGEGLTRYAELRAPQMIVDDAGELAVTKEGAGEIEALAKAFGGAYATHAIETIEHIPGGKWAKGKLAKHMPSGLMRKGRAIAKAVAKVKDKFPRLNAAMRAFNKATGFHGLGREIFGEEGAEAFVNALGNLQNEYEKAGVQNLPEGFMRFAKEVPDMALSMSILRGGQYAIGTPGYIAANARRHKDMKTALKAFGLSDARIRGMSVEARADKLNELWESVVTDAQAEDVATVARQAVPEIFPEQAPEFGEPGGEEAERPEPATTPATEPLAPAPGTAETSQEALTGPEPTPTPTAPEIVESERPAPSPEAGFEASMAAGAPVAAPLAEPATGTTPEATGEAVPPTPEAVADELGIEYGGFQVGTKKTPATYLFTDPVTHDSFNVADLRDAKRQLEELRAGYKVVRGKGEDIEKVLTGEIGVRPDLMQYKKMDDPRAGTREADKITGAWAYRKGGVLLLWEPKNPEAYGLAAGERYIVANGHHRLAAAQEQGVDYLNAQILREADGYSVEEARVEAAEINIADGKGTIYDQANWFRNTAAMVGADEALESGKRIGAQGRKAQTIGLQASDNVYSSFINEQITPDQAYQIAKAAPDNDAAQQVGLQRALQGLEGSHLANFIYAVKEYGAEQPDGIQLDLFGQDDAAIAAMDRQAGIATEHQQALKDQIASVRGAAKRPDLARELGVDVNDPAAVQRRIDELRQEAKRWEEWPDHPDLVAIVKGEDAAIPKQEPLPFQVEEEEETGEFVAPEELERPTPPAAVPQANVAGLDAKLEGLRERWKNGPKQIVVLATQDDAPGRIKQHAPEGGFRGAYDPVDDVVYLVADRLGDPNAGEFVVIHEVIGHRGIKAVLGEKGAREFYRGLAAARNKDVGAYAKSKGLPYKTAADRRTAAAEWLADRIAQGDFDAVKPWYEKLLALLRDALAGLTGRTFTDAELGQLVEASHRFTEGEEVKPGETGPTYFSQPEFSRAEPTEAPVPEQLAEGHVIARRLFPSAKGVMGKEYRAFAERVTGKPSMAEMTSAEADKFVSALRGFEGARRRARLANKQAADRRAQISALAEKPPEQLDFPNVPVPDLYDEWLANKDERMMAADVDTHTIQEEIRKITGSKRLGAREKEIDMAIFVNIDLRGKEIDQINKYYGTLAPEQQKLVDHSQNLTQAEQRIADKIIALNEKSGQEALQAGILRHLIDEAYLARIWERELESRRGLLGKFKPSTERALPRTLESVLHGWALGKELRIKGASTACQVARKQIAQAIEDRKLLDLAKSANLISSKPEADDWVEVEHPNFARWEFAGKAEPGKVYARGLYVDDDGNLFQRRKQYAEPELGKKLNNALGRSKLKGIPAVDLLTEANAIIKTTILFTSLFHHQAFVRSYTIGSPGIDPIKAYEDGKKAIANFEPQLRELVRGGLTVGLIRDWEEEVLGEKTRIGRMIDRIPGGTQFKQPLTDLWDMQTNFLFHKLGPYLKVQAGLLEYRRALADARDDLESGKTTRQEIAKEVASLINDDFGGLHLARLGRYGRNPTLQHLFRLVALAPDWTESNVRTMVKAFKTGREGAMYRAFWGRVLLTGIGTTILFNLLLSFFDDKTFWKRYQEAWRAGNLRWLDVDITPIYRALGGKDGKRKYFSLIGHFRDPVKFAVRPFRSAKHKGSVLSRIAVEALTGTDWAGRPFTSFSELLGVDDKGVYKTTRPGHYKKGQPKGGKYKGRLVTTPWERGGAISWGQLPSYLVYELRGAAPIQVQEAISWLAGEIDGFDAITKSLGLMTHTTYPKEEKSKPEQRRTSGSIAADSYQVGW